MLRHYYIFKSVWSFIVLTLFLYNTSVGYDIFMMFNAFKKWIEFYTHSYYFMLFPLYMGLNVHIYCSTNRQLYNSWPAAASCSSSDEPAGCDLEWGSLCWEGRREYPNIVLHSPHPLLSFPQPLAAPLRCIHHNTHENKHTSENGNWIYSEKFKELGLNIDKVVKSVTETKGCPSSH